MTAPVTELEQTINRHLGEVLFGLEQTIHALCIALIAKGHVLLEGPPGQGKTLLAKTLARQLAGRFKRIQCTADMMPSDMTGIHVYNAETRSFELLPGPLFADVVLVDEINRTGPKTQSALLQAMEEGGVTLDRQTYNLPDNFLVLASQNPYEFEGAYPLPESQLDRFLLRLIIGYPAAAVEKQILRTYDRPDGGHEEKDLPTLPVELLARAREQARQVLIAEPIYDYVCAIAAATREHAQLSLGLSTRGALALMRCARVEAALQGRDYVIPDDVKALAGAVMAHRLVLTPEAVLQGLSAERLTETLLAQVEAPRALP